MSANVLHLSPGELSGGSGSNSAGKQNGKRSARTVSPHEMHGFNSTFSHPIPERFLRDHVRASERLKLSSGEPYSFETACISIYLDTDAGKQKSKSDYERIFGWTRQELRERWNRIVTTVEQLSAGFGGKSGAKSTANNQESREISSETQPNNQNGLNVQANNQRTTNEQPNGNQEVGEKSSETTSNNQPTTNQQPTNNQHTIQSSVREELCSELAAATTPGEAAELEASPAKRKRAAKAQKPESQLGDVLPAETEPGDFDLVLNSGRLWRVRPEALAELQRLYPAVDVRQAFRKMRAWSLTNPTKRKTVTGVAKHVNTWLSGAQDRAGGYSNGSAYKNGATGNDGAYSGNVEPPTNPNVFHVRT